MSSEDPPEKSAQEINWGDLIDAIRYDKVIPVVGPELLAVPGAGGELVSLEARIAQEFARRLQVADLPSTARIQDVANAYFARGNADPTYGLQSKLIPVLARIKDIPPAFEQLAQILDFRLFVAVTPDGLLEAAINKVRSAGRSEALRITNGEQVPLEDLPEPIERLQSTVVFYPFGRLADKDFAITEEDTLEWLFRLISRASRLERLATALKGAHLLFLGCNFPDWLTRFWIRVLTGGRIQAGTRSGRATIADRTIDRDQSLVMFLRRTEIQVWSAGGAAEFVTELHRHWRDSAPESAALPAPSAAPRGPIHVFISYSMTTDKAAAEEVNRRLKAAKLETWFDTEDIASGQRVEVELKRNVESAYFFVPILSRAAAARVKGYYRYEWQVALEYAKQRSPALPFIHPVVVDDLQLGKPGPAGIPPELWDLVSVIAPGGQISPDFAKRLELLVRAIQS